MENQTETRKPVSRLPFILGGSLVLFGLASLGWWSLPWLMRSKVIPIQVDRKGTPRIYGVSLENKWLRTAILSMVSRSQATVGFRVERQSVINKHVVIQMMNSFTKAGIVNISLSGPIELIDFQNTE